MKLELKRIAYRSTYTIGNLYIDGVYFCDTLEDVPREIKKMHETCIPKGIYTVILNVSNRFKVIMPLLLNVPNFEGIRIHSGNTSADTSGCILVGQNKVKGKVINSKETYKKLMSIFEKANDKITIEVS